MTVPGIFTKTGYIEKQLVLMCCIFLLGWQYHTCEDKMAEQRENYKGREIIVRTGTDASAARAAAGLGVDDARGEGVELSIDGEQVFVLRNPSGTFIASGFAFDPQPSPIDLAKKIIDYREATE